jgi:hypothetical protein
MIAAQNHDPGLVENKGFAVSECFENPVGRYKFPTGRESS